jgi:hypothetical protein
MSHADIGLGLLLSFALQDGRKNRNAESDIKALLDFGFDR